MSIEIFIDSKLYVIPAQTLLRGGLVWYSLGSPHLTFSSFILQFSSQSKTPDSSQELQQALEDRAQLEARVGQVRPCRARGARGG